MPTFTSTTRTQLVNAVLARLGDVSGVYWSSAEIIIYLTEALRCWGLLTAYWRDFGTFNTSAGTSFYNLLTLVGSDGSSLLSQTVTDSQLVAEIQYHLLEPSTGTSWTGSEQFTLNDLTQALQRRRDKFLIDTAAVITRTSGIAVGAPPVGRITLPGSVFNLRRVAFSGAISGDTQALWAADVGSQRNYDTGYTITAGEPGTFTTITGRPQELIFAPPLSEPGTVEILSVSAGSTLDPTTGVALGIPDDCAWIIKWGVMADILGKDGPARDPQRSSFCERRYRLGVELARLMPTVVNVDINGVPTSPDTISNVDAYNPTWQSSTGQPTFALAFPNLLALAPAPDANYSARVDVVRKALLPVLGADYIQISSDHLDPIVDYVCHLAMFKMGGEEFEASYRGAQNFFDAALMVNRRLSAQNPAAVELMKQSKRDESVREYEQPGGLGPLQDRPAVSSVSDPRSGGG